MSAALPHSQLGVIEDVYPPNTCTVQQWCRQKLNMRRWRSCGQETLRSTTLGLCVAPYRIHAQFHEDNVSSVCMCACACLFFVCLREREREGRGGIEREREREKEDKRKRVEERLCAPKRESNHSAFCFPPGSRVPCACVRVCVCVRARRTKIEQERDFARKRECQITLFIALFQGFELLVCVSKREGERERESARAPEKAGEREITRAKERTESLCLLCVSKRL